MTQDKMTAVRERMQHEQILWMATTRPDGRPHVAPIWFVWHEDRAYVMTLGVKVENVRHNGLAALNTEDGSKVVIIEGTARIVPRQDAVFESAAKLFMERYEWDIHTATDNELIEITPVKTLLWNA
jgi:nitroimidazol reductase NimA-like FMN-containing flavoprotein (pyridoxamine 5'-phosphate oxidase superfamily)